MATYQHCVRHYRSGPKADKCADYAIGPGRRKPRRKSRRRGATKGLVCIRYRRRPGEKRCAKFGTKAEARALGLL